MNSVVYLQCIIFKFVIILEGVDVISGHGRLVEPPSRASMWRYGFDSPVNYADNQLFCGGYTVQWEKNKGKCGVCGDPYDGEREHEAGGKYARGIIVRRYTQDGIIDVVVEITAPHGGWFEFRLCPNDDPRKPVTWKCLNKHLLELADGSGTKYKITQTKPGYHEIHLKLPKGLTCAQCVLQWKYNAGNSWGVGADGKGCIGCGPQEQFYGCADIAVGNDTLPDSVTLPYWRDVYPEDNTPPTVTQNTYNIAKIQKIMDTTDKLKNIQETEILDKYSEEFIKGKLLQLANYFFPSDKHNSATRNYQLNIYKFVVLVFMTFVINYEI